jgi:hypothetical protein
MNERNERTENKMHHSIQITYIKSVGREKNMVNGTKDNIFNITGEFSRLGLFLDFFLFIEVVKNDFLQSC